MLIKDLDGNGHNWLLTGNMAKGKISNRSSLHLQTRDLLKIIYPTLQILEEVPIPLRKNETLYLDFYIPMLKTAIEAHGEQHYKFVPFYHNNTMGFLKSKKRDQEKIEWCAKNNIKHIVLSYSESEDEWRKQLNDQNS